VSSHESLKTDSSPEAFQACADATFANAVGPAVGEFLRWEEGQSAADGFVAYAELRRWQLALGQRAAISSAASYLASGDEAALVSALDASAGVGFANADLASPLPASNE
jgi:hypothetical protein